MPKYRIPQEYKRALTKALEGPIRLNQPKRPSPILGPAQIRGRLRRHKRPQIGEVYPYTTPQHAYVTSPHVRPIPPRGPMYELGQPSFENHPLNIHAKSVMARMFDPESKVVGNVSAHLAREKAVSSAIKLARTSPTESLLTGAGFSARSAQILSESISEIGGPVYINQATGIFSFGIGGKKYGIERLGGHVPGVPTVVTHQGQLLTKGVAPGETSPMLFGRRHLSRAAVLIDESSGTATHLTGQEYAATQMREYIRTHQHLDASEIRRGAIEAYDKATSEVVLSEGVKPSSLITAKTQQKILLRRGTGELLTLNESIQEGIEARGGMFEPSGIPQPGVVAESIEEALRGVQVSSTALSIAGIKPEAVLEGGFLTGYGRHAMVPFGHLTLPTAQMWQRYGQSAFTARSVKKFGGTKYGRISKPYFMTGLSKNIRQEAEAANIRRITEIAQIQERLTGLTPTGVAPVHTMNVEMGFVMGKVTPQGVKPASTEFVNQLFSSQGEIYASKEFMGLEESLVPKVNLSSEQWIERIAGQKLTAKVGRGAILTGAGKFTIAGPFQQVGGEALGLVGSAELLQKTYKKQFGSYIEMEFSTMLARAESMASKSKIGNAQELLKGFYTLVASAVGGRAIRHKGGVGGILLGGAKRAKRLAQEIGKAGSFELSAPYKTVVAGLEELRKQLEVEYTGYIGRTELQKLIEARTSKEELIERGAAVVKGVGGEEFIALRRTTEATLRKETPLFKTTYAPYKPGALPFHAKGMPIGREFFAALESHATPQALAVAKHLRTVASYSPDILAAREAIRVITQSTRGGSSVLPGSRKQLYKMGEFLNRYRAPKILTGKGNILTKAGRITPAELEGTLWDPRIFNAFSIALEHPVTIENPITGAATQITEVPFINRRALLSHLASEQGVLPNKVISAEERIFELLHEYKGDIPQGEIDRFQNLLFRRSEALAGTLIGKGGLIAGAIQPRLAGTAYLQAVSPTLAQKEAGQIFARVAGTPTELITQTSVGTYARAIGRKPVLSTLLAEGLVETEKVGGELRYFTSGIITRFPIQGRTSSLASKIYLTPEKASEPGYITATSEYFRLHKGDTDHDTVAAIFAKSHRERMLFREMSKATNLADYAERQNVLGSLEDFLAGEGRVLSEYTAKSAKASEETFVRSIGNISKTFATKSITGPLNEYFMKVWTTMLHERSADRLGKFSPDAIRRATDLLDIGYQVGSIKKSEAADIRLFEVLSNITKPAAGAGGGIEGLTDKLTYDLRKATVDLLLEGTEYGGGVAVRSELSGIVGQLKKNTALSRMSVERMSAEHSVLSKLSKMEGDAFTKALGEHPEFVKQIDDMLAPLIHTAGVMNDPAYKAAALGANIGLDRLIKDKALTEEKGKIISDIMKNLDDIQASVGQELDPRRQVNALVAKLLSFGHEPGDIYEALGVHPYEELEQVDAKAAKKLADTGRKAGGPSAWSKAVDWFKDASKPAWQKIGIAAGALMIGGAFVKNTFFPDIVPERPSTELPYTPGVVPALDPEIWKQLPTIQDLGGTMPAVGPSYGPRLQNPRPNATIGPSIQQFALPGNFSGDTSSSPMPPASQLEHGTAPGIHEVRIPTQRNVPMSLPDHFSMAPIRPEQQGTQIQVAPYSVYAEEQMLQTFGAAGNVDVAMSPSQSHLERRRQINSNGSILRPPTAPYGMM